MTLVSASPASSSTSSPAPMSASLPSETSLAKPSPRAAPRESSVPSMVPLCETILVEPAGSASISRTAFTVSAKARLPCHAFLAGVCKAVGEDAHDRHAATAAILERALDGIAGSHDESVIDLSRRLGDARPGSIAENFRPRRIDRQDAARVAVFLQEALRPRRVLFRVAGCADQRDSAGGEKRLREIHTLT